MLPIPPSEKGHRQIRKSLAESLADIPEFRRTCKGNFRYPAKDILDACREFLRRTLFTGDAMGCQIKIIDKIREADAHYLLGVKDNQKTLAAGIELTHRLKRPCDEFTTVDAGHGRVVTRTCKTYSDLSLIENLPNWRDLQMQFVIESRVRTVKNNQWTNEVRFYISDLPENAEFFNLEVRRHWMIENYLHWNLDYAFRQDRCVRKDTTASRNLDTIQKIAFTILSINKIWIKKGCGCGNDQKDEDGRTERICSEEIS